MSRDSRSGLICIIAGTESSEQHRTTFAASSATRESRANIESTLSLGHSGTEASLEAASSIREPHLIVSYLRREETLYRVRRFYMLDETAEART